MTLAHILFRPLVPLDLSEFRQVCGKICVLTRLKKAHAALAYFSCLCLHQQMRDILFPPVLRQKRSIVFQGSRCFLVVFAKLPHLDCQRLPIEGLNALCFPPFSI